MVQAHPFDPVAMATTGPRPQHTTDADALATAVSRQPLASGTLAHTTDAAELADRSGSSTDVDAALQSTPGHTTDAAALPDVAAPRPRTSSYTLANLFSQGHTTDAGALTPPIVPEGQKATSVRMATLGRNKGMPLSPLSSSSTSTSTPGATPTYNGNSSSGTGSSTAPININSSNMAPIGSSSTSDTSRHASTTTINSRTTNTRTGTTPYTAGQQQQQHTDALPTSPACNMPAMGAITLTKGQKKLLNKATKYHTAALDAVEKLADALDQASEAKTPERSVKHIYITTFHIMRWFLIQIA